MGKAVKEYKKGDFIFAKVKGYPAWPARVRAVNGKKYFVFFYGTGETANLAANVLFDYVENKDKLTKNVKRKFFSEGVQQIDYDFKNNVPLEDDGAPIAAPANDTMDDSGTADTTADETADDSAMDTTAADTTVADESAAGTQNSTAVEDSDEGPLVIDEGKKTKKERKKSEPSTPKTTKEKADKPDKSSEKAEKADKVEKPEKESPAPKEKETPAKETRTPRSKREKETPVVEKEKEKEKDKEEIISRSGRKIRPKRYIDEVTEESPLAPAPKKRRAQSPTDKESEKPEEPERPSKFNFFSQAELQELTELPSEESDGELLKHLVVARATDGRYVGVKLLENRPSTGSDVEQLDWLKANVAKCLKVKQDIEEGKVRPKDLGSQVVLDLHPTEAEKAAMDKEWEIEEKKYKMSFLETEFALIEQDSKIKQSLNLENADTDTCLKLLDEYLEMNVKPLMLLKHPICLESIKRLRCYVGNTESWKLSSEEEAEFKTKAQAIRAKAEKVFEKMQELFVTPAGITFWEYFSQRVMHFKLCTAELSAEDMCTMVREPAGMLDMPSIPLLKDIGQNNTEQKEESESVPEKKKKTNSNDKSDKPEKALKRESSKKVVDKDESAQKNGQKEDEEPKNESEDPKEHEKDKEDLPKDAKKEKGDKVKADKKDNKDKKDKKEKEDKEKETEKEDNGGKRKTREAKDKEDKDKETDKEDNGGKRKTRESKESAKKTDTAVRTPTKRKSIKS